MLYLEWESLRETRGPLLRQRKQKPVLQGGEGSHTQASDRPHPPPSELHLGLRASRAVKLHG